MNSLYDIISSMARSRRGHAARAPAEQRRSSARERSRAESRRRLLAAGRRLFERRGVAGVNSNEIARAAEVATGTFYLHFENKHDLLRAIVRDGLADLRAMGDPLVAASDGRLETVVRIRAEVLLRFCESHERLIRLIFGPEGVAAGAVQILANAALERVRFVAGRRAELRGNPGGLSRELAIESVAAMRVRTATWWCDHMSSADREDAVETLVEFTLSAIDLAFSARRGARRADEKDQKTSAVENEPPEKGGAEDGR